MYFMHEKTVVEHVLNTLSFLNLIYCLHKIKRENLIDTSNKSLIIVQFGTYS